MSPPSFAAGPSRHHRLPRAARVGLLVVAAILALVWLRTTMYWDVVRVRAGTHHVWLGTQPSALQLTLLTRHGPPGSFQFRYEPKRFYPGVGSHLFDFSLATNTAASEFDRELDAFIPITVTTLTVPIWPLLLLCVAPAAWHALAAQRRRRLCDADRCAGCGYDLRASPDRCPECGQPRPAIA